MKTLAETMQMLGGPFLYFQGLILVAVMALSVRTAIRYFSQTQTGKPTFLNSHHLVLFLGIFSFVWGMFTQLVGIIIALNAIIEAADVSPELILTGLKNSFVSPVFGLSTMLLSALLWGILHGRYTRSLKDR
jgi:hypothetical protein